MTIVSYSRKFVFVKTRKVAGTSVEGLLRRVCGAEDVVTPVTPIDDAVLIAEGLVPRNYTKDDTTAEQRYVKTIEEGDHLAAMTLLKGINYRFKNHMTAKQIRSRLADSFWSEAFKFTIERHPYSYVLSASGFSTQTYNRGESEIFGDDELRRRVDIYLSKENPKNDNFRSYLDDEGRVCVDFIARYENLLDDLEHCLAVIGAEASATDLPQFKTLRRIDQNQAADVLTGEQKKKIQDRYHLVFDLLGYAK